MENAVEVSPLQKNLGKFCNYGSATIFASYLAKYKGFNAHFSYIACDHAVRSQNVFSLKLRKTASAARAN
jgi:hypothetical protein